MIHFPFLEQFGVTAIMSDRSDGDCQSREGVETFLASSTIDLDLPVHLLSQVHSATMVEACAASNAIKADGLYTQHSDRVLGVRIADCVPIILFDPVKRVGAVVHAGRAGTFRSIAAEAVNALSTQFQSKVTDIHAVVGPSAGPCCYEVSEEIAQEFVEHGGEAHGRNLDLWATNRKQLLALGLQSDRIEINGSCTICTDQFHSYRKNAPTARNIAILHIHPK